MFSVGAGFFLLTGFAEWVYKRLTMNSPSEGILEEALRISSTSRRESYGHPLPNHQRIAALWNGYLQSKGVGAVTDLTLEPADVVMMMILVKMAREMNTTTRDNFTDIAGYARVGAIIKGHE